MFNIVIVGLGLIGGSAAMALKGFSHGGEQTRVTGVDSDEAVLRKAKACGAVTEAYPPERAGEALRDADMLALCLYPVAALDFLTRNTANIPAKCVVTDVCGVKGEFVERSAAAVPQAAYVGGHPMAGRELSGFGAAIPGLFAGCNYIVTPSRNAGEEAVELVCAFAKHLGAAKVTLADPATHDRNIAYTSQLAHVLAAAVVENPVLLETKGFEGGSLADITRVAKLNARMWSELFVLNGSNLTGAIRQLEASLQKFRLLIERGAVDELRAELENATRNKERWANE